MVRPPGHTGADGYRRIWIEGEDGGPRECRSEHREVVRQYIFGTNIKHYELPFGSIVHHRDRRRANNDLYNLLLLPDQTCHQIVHRYMANDDSKHLRIMEQWAWVWMGQLAKKAAMSDFNGFTQENRKVIDPIDLSQIIKDDPRPIAFGDEHETLLSQVLFFRGVFPDHLLLIDNRFMYYSYERDAEELAYLFGYKTVFDIGGAGLLSAGFPHNVVAERIRDLRNWGVPYVVIDSSKFRSRRGLLTRVATDIFRRKAPHMAAGL